MTAPQTTPSSLKTRLAGEIRRDPKKVAILGVLLVILLVVGIREIPRRVGPSSAEAATASLGQAGASLATGGPGAATPGRARAGAVQRDSEADKDEDLSDLGKQPVTRDLFLISSVHFPVEEAVKAASPLPVVENPAAKYEAELRILQGQAKALTLQSTMVGAVSTAIINGQVLKSGEWISGFQVVEITARNCTIDKQGTRLILELAN